jgi:hypothetical protein
MSIGRTAQTMRNSLQATRINAVGQVRNMFGGGVLSLQENGEGNNVTNGEPTGMQGPFGMWNFPIISKFAGGGGFGIYSQPAPGATRMGMPSGAASGGGTRGVQSDIRDPAYGIHIY